MKIGIGIDFGTSNSSAALFDGERVHAVELDAAATVQGDVMPTILYVDRSLRRRSASRPCTGTSARTSGGP